MNKDFRFQTGSWSSHHQGWGERAGGSSGCWAPGSGGSASRPLSSCPPVPKGGRGVAAGSPRCPSPLCPRQPVMMQLHPRASCRPHIWAAKHLQQRGDTALGSQRPESSLLPPPEQPPPQSWARGGCRNWSQTAGWRRRGRGARHGGEEHPGAPELKKEEEERAVAEVGSRLFQERENKSLAHRPI